jgi:hypothetical protein
MAQVLSKTGITTSNTVEAWHVSQSVDAFTGIAAYDISISGSLTVTGSIKTTQGISGSFTGSFGGNLNGTALLATTASYALTSSFGASSISSSFAQTASYVKNAQTASYVENAQTASYVVQAISASFATTAQTSTTASYVLNAVSASFATSASRAVSSSFATTASFARVFPFTGSAVILGSLEVSSTSFINGITIGRKNVSSTQLGNAALLSLTTGTNNTGVGYQAGFNIQGTSGNTIVGATALFQAFSDNNTAIGYSSLYNITSGTGNTALGTNSGYNNTTGNYNVYIGNEVYGVSGESNKLKIHSSVSNTTTPLISGDFSTRDLTINGDLTVSGSQVLTLQPVHPLPSSGVATGSFAVSASIPPRPYMWDGSSWYAL